MLSVRGLHVAYGRSEVLRGIDLTVAAGEVVGLVGPNGCGKTTLLKAVTRIVPWTLGDVLFGEESAASLGPRQLARRVAVVPQSSVLPVGYTALEVVLMGRTPYLSFLQQEGPEDYRRAREALTRVGAAAFADRRVDEMSGGERQNVLIARALAQDAPLLLLDEPTANLDIGHQIEVARLVRELAAAPRRVGVLAAIHDLTLASLYCDRLALIADGVIVATGVPSAVLTAENIRRAYRTEAMLLDAPGLPSPIVVPYAPGT